MRRRWTGALAALLLALPAVAGVPAPVARALAEAGLPEEALAYVVAPVGRGPRLVEHGAERPMQPASTMKLLTTLVALDQLGPAYRGRTRVLAAGAVVEGSLQGDLVLQGGGDADLGWEALQTLLRRLRDRGLRDIRGDLVLDRTAFVPARPDLGVPPFDEKPWRSYGVIPDALFVNANLLQLELFTDERGLQIAAAPLLAGVRVSHEMTLVHADCAEWEEHWQPPEVRPHRLLRQLEVVLRGAWPLGCERSIELNVLDRNEFVTRLFRTLWSGMGGTWRGRVREGPTPPQARLLAEHESRPLAELVRAANKPSDNPLARLLYLALGRASEGEPGEPTATRAERAIRRWLRRHGIADDGLVLENGSGLSRSERISAAQLEAVIRAGLAGRWAPEFASSLPIAGVDGTLRNRLAGSPAAGWARLKSGTLRNATTLAGTLPDGAGEPRIVVVFVNHERAVPKVARPVVDAFVDWVARTRFGEPAR